MFSDTSGVLVAYQKGVRHLVENPEVHLGGLGTHASSSRQGADRVLLQSPYSADDSQALLQTYGGTGSAIDEELFNGDGAAFTGDIASELGLCDQSD